jgi:hypothetical protein
MCGSTSRRSASASAYAIVRIPAARVSDMIFINSAAMSVGSVSENNPGIEAGSREPDASSAECRAN